jgi:methylisocitrate lyase
MSTVHALQANLAALSGLRGQPLDALPSGRSSITDFKQLIGWQALEQQQARYEGH